jgi:hypothetical protein
VLAELGQTMTGQETAPDGAPNPPPSAD